MSHRSTLRCYFVARDETPWKRLPFWGSVDVHWYASLSHTLKSHSLLIGSLNWCLKMLLLIGKNVAGTGMGAAAVFERGDGVDELRNARKVEAQGFLSKDAR